MKQKDYYAILEVHKKSSREEIKSQYRRLAKIYHPDANINDSTAEERFKDLTVAYDILMDKEKKRKYDRQILRYGYGAVPKVDKKKVSATDIINKVKKLSGETVNVMSQATEAIKVKIESIKEEKKGENIEATLEITLDEGFFGTEKKLSLKSISGKISNYSVTVPRGIKDSEKIRLAALGKPGKNGGKPGDLIITIKIKKDPKFSLNGNNVEMNLNISYVQSIIGDKFTSKLFNEKVDIELEEMTKNNSKIVLRDRGYYINDARRGDLIVNVNVLQPEKISEREKKIYAQLLKVEKQAKSS